MVVDEMTFEGVIRESDHVAGVTGFIEESPERIIVFRLLEVPENSGFKILEGSALGRGRLRFNRQFMGASDVAAFSFLTIDAVNLVVAIAVM